MKKTAMIARYLLGLAFLVFGLNGFLNFLPSPPLTEAGLKFIMALVETGYLMMLVKGIEVLAGVLLLAGIYVPLALLLLAPIVVNIVLFHTILSPGIAVPLVLLILGLVTAYDRKEAFRSVLQMK